MYRSSTYGPKGLNGVNTSDPPFSNLKCMRTYNFLFWLYTERSLGAYIITFVALAAAIIGRTNSAPFLCGKTSTGDGDCQPND